jgi:hypothetical protein
MNTTLNISKSIAKIVSTACGTLVSTHKLGSFANIIADLTTVTITGTSSANKLEKFQKQLAAAGFKMESTAWCHNADMESDATATTYNITYSK